MKHLVIIITIISLSLKLFAFGNEICEGFYVTLNDDTVKCKFRVPLTLIGGIGGEKGPDLMRLNVRIEIEDSIKGKNKLRPGEVKGFSFSYKGKEQKFLSKPNYLDYQDTSLSKNDSIFLKTIVNGQLKLYEYLSVIDPITRHESASAPVHTGAGLYEGEVITSYCLQWKDEVPFKPSMRPKKLKEDLIWYLAACPELTKKIKTEEYTKEDLEAIVNEYNNCKK